MDQPSGKGAKGEKATVKETGQTASASLNLEEIREIANLIDKHGFTDFEFENENIRVRLSKNPAPQIVQAVQPVNVQSSTSPAASSAGTSAESASAGSAAGSASAEDDLYKITSPIVGTFYRSPAPDKPAYVDVGANVTDSTVVCIVEAMKLMNEIQAEVSGEVVKIYVENGQPVEFGQPLFGIRK